jgi:hypothetical protein
MLVCCLYSNQHPKVQSGLCTSACCLYSKQHNSVDGVKHDFPVFFFPLIASLDWVFQLKVEDFLLFKIPNLHAPIPNFKPCLVVKIDDNWVPTTKIGLESGFGKVRFENPTPQEVFQSIDLSLFLK